ncbi:MAG: peptidylprolyl isomerase [Kiritimatiellales bacterium]
MKKMVSSLVTCLLLAGGSAVAAPSADGLYATLQTTMGDVCFELYYTNVPRTVANFVSLAEGSRSWIDPRDGFISNEPYYNGIIFHRVINGFMIQAGSPKGDGTDGPGYAFEDEFDPALRHDRPGIVSMANSGPDSNGGQFFITVDVYPYGNDMYSIFGSVVEGMSIVYNIAAVATDANDRPLEDVTVTNVFITRNGTDAQNFAVTNQALPEVMPLPIEIANSNGIKISTGTATSSYQYIYASTNLSDWVEYTSGYWPVPTGTAELSLSSDSRGYFHAARVVYPMDKNRTGSPILHRLVIMVGSNVVTVEPDGINSGRVTVDSAPNAALTYWEWDPVPVRVRFILQSDYYNPFGFDLYYTSPTNGTCDVYLYNSGWQYFGAGTFTDQDLN